MGNKRHLVIVTGCSYLDFSWLIIKRFDTGHHAFDCKSGVVQHSLKAPETHNLNIARPLPLRCSCTAPRSLASRASGRSFTSWLAASAFVVTSLPVGVEERCVT